MNGMDPRRFSANDPGSGGGTQEGDPNADVGGTTTAVGGAGGSSKGVDTGGGNTEANPGGGGGTTTTPPAGQPTPLAVTQSGLPMWAKVLLALLTVGGVAAIGWAVFHKPGSKEHKRLAHHAHEESRRYAHRARKHRAEARKVAREEAAERRRSKR